MAELSAQFAAISPDMDISDATDGLVSVMKAFKIDVSDVKEGIMSEINEIGNNFGTSNSEIITGLEKSSASMQAANNSLEQTIALFTSGVEITRDADAMGSALKTISMRIRGKFITASIYSNVYAVCA
jgi:TP901 family phage tail tape measure protein